MITHCNTQRLEVKNLETVFCDSINDVNQKDWDTIVDNRNTYLSIPYLKAIESGLGQYDFRYVIFYDTLRNPIGVTYCQIISITSNEINTKALVQRMGGMLPKSLINSIDMRILICGNAFASGENGFLFNPDIFSKQALEVVSSAIDEIHQIEKKRGKKIAVTLIKEFWPESFDSISFLKEKGCSEIDIDVNMVLTLHDSWNTFEDYLKAMNSKFRTKAKQVLKKSEALEIVDFDVPTIEARLEQIDALYSTIVDRANFSFGRLNAQTLLNVKRALGEDFLFKGYYLKSELIGFSTATAFDDVLDGNFIGLDYDYNQEYAVYQRMLYDFVKHALSIGAKYVKIGRTAEEIKSGIGALPINMKFYAKHRNKVTNALLKPFVSKLKPSDFNLRKPFKVEYYSE
ncbi:MAG: hypothetical protein COA58_03095 [Bacteroidetes bacterium]|nr:MAG: hypothetical protein COA58_03095 [Bacteroidota bacterium]